MTTTPSPERTPFWNDEPVGPKLDPPPPPGVLSLPMPPPQPWLPPPPPALFPELEGIDQPWTLYVVRT